jgi:hypothetical protein
VTVEGRGQDYIDAQKFMKDYYGSDYAVMDVYE